MADNPDLSSSKVTTPMDHDRDPDKSPAIERSFRDGPPIRPGPRKTKSASTVLTSSTRTKSSKHTKKGTSTHTAKERVMNGSPVPQFVDDPSTVCATELQEVFGEAYDITVSADEESDTSAIGVDQLNPSLDELDLLANHVGQGQFSLLASKTKARIDLNCTDTGESDFDNCVEVQCSPDVWHLKPGTKAASSSTSQDLVLDSSVDQKNHYQCEVCKMIFKRRKSYLTHQNRYHAGGHDVIHRCDVCNLIFAGLVDLNVHRLSHSRSTPAKWTTTPIVHSSSTASADQAGSKRTKRAAKSNSVPVAGPQDGLRTSSRLKSTKKTSPEPVSDLADEMHFICVDCGGNFNDHDSYIDHTCKKRSKPPRKRNYNCHLCTNTFSCAHDLTLHLRVHTGEKPFTCTHPGCNKSFARQGNLNCHLIIHAARTDHTAKVHECHVCLKRFINYPDLKRHSRIHTKEKPFSCSQCELSFSRRDVLNRHQQTHEGVRPYKCQLCPKAFAGSQWLNFHMKCHELAKPFKCEWCEQVFAKNDALNRHIAKHTGKLPHTCYACGVGFIRRLSLEKHEGKCRVRGIAEPEDKS